jgi:penicillin-insensitive murein endopeptidase
LFNAVQLPENPAWKRVDPSHAWATTETVDYLVKALTSVARRFPGTEPVSIGHLSAQKGGPLRPHVSHQSGRDVDVGFYYSGEPNRWYKRATVENLDLERTWWFVRTLVRETEIEMILLDQSLIDSLERYALGQGEERAWVEGIFHRRDGRPAIMRHASGHATHLHLRFFNPVAQASGRRLMPLLLARGVVSAPPKYTIHVARAGDTLAKLATHYSTTMQAIRQANAMNTYQLVAGKRYRIPSRTPDTTAASPASQPSSSTAAVGPKPALGAAKARSR